MNLDKIGFILSIKKILDKNLDISNPGSSH